MITHPVKSIGKATATVVGRHRGITVQPTILGTIPGMILGTHLGMTGVIITTAGVGAGMVATIIRGIVITDLTTM